MSKEIKRSLLVEYDAGFISPKENSKFINEIKGLQEKKSFDFAMPVLYGVMQKYGVENKNERIYPEALLRREVEKYLELIKMGTSAGESDHPSCHSEGAEILTKNGWKDLKDISENECIYTLNPKGCLELQTITKKIAQPYHSQMLRFKGRNINCEVTPNHRFLIVKRNGTYDYITAQDIYDRNYVDLGHCYIPKVVQSFETFTNPNITIEGLKIFEKGSPKTFKEKMSKDLIINAKDFCEFLGIYLSEGHFVSRKNDYRIGISQVKEESTNQIREMLTRIGFTFKEYHRNRGNILTEFIIRDARLHNYLKKLGKAKDKYIPHEIKQLPKECLEELVRWFHIGDGRTRYGTTKSIFSISKRMMDDFQEVLLKIGKSGNLTIEKVEKDYMINTPTPHLVLAKNRSVIHNLNIAKTKGIHLRPNNVSIEPFIYNGNVYCVEVPNGNFYVRQNGKAHWSGNSAVISIQNTAMRVKNLWWEGRTLMGEIYLPITRGYIEMGIISHPADKIAHDIIHGFQYGVSSRGVGSLKTINGQNIVQDDFELICWDFVTTPSTNNAWVFTNKEATKPYVESAEKSKFEMQEDKPKDVFDYFSEERKKSIDSALNNFLNKF